MAIPSNDRALRFYQEVLGLDRLHFGLWTKGDELTFANLKEAQKRYEDFVFRLFQKKHRRIKIETLLIDAQEFARNKQYCFFLFQSPTAAKHT